MQTLKKGASFLSEAKDRLTRARSSSSGDALKLPEGGGPGKSNAFYNCSPQEAHCRKLLVHQEAVAGVVDRYMCAVLYALDDLAAAHENLGAGLQQAGDLVDGAWHGHVEALATALRQAATAGRDQLLQNAQELQQLRQRHREAVKLASEAEAAANRRQHYEQKVQRLRQEVKSARDALGTAALDPDGAGARSSGLLSKSLNQRKTNTYDMKQGQLCRNEEKLTRITELQRGAHAASLRALLVSVTFGRQRLQGLVQDILSCCMERLLPSIHEHQVAAATSAPPPRDAPARSNVKPRRQLEDVAEAPPVVGDMVCVQGLNSAAQYNDQNGTVKSVRPDGRIEIELVLEGEGDKVLAVRPENLRRLCPQQLPSQCSGLLGQGEALVLDEWDPRAAESDDTEAEVRPGERRSSV